MLINLIFITVFALIWGSLILVAYKFGYADGMDRDIGVGGNMQEEKAETNCHITADQNRISTILYNIDNYDGTGLGQKEV